MAGVRVVPELDGGPASVAAATVERRIFVSDIPARADHAKGDARVVDLHAVVSLLGERGIRAVSGWRVRKIKRLHLKELTSPYSS